MKLKTSVLMGALLVLLIATGLFLMGYHSHSSVSDSQNRSPLLNQTTPDTTTSDANADVDIDLDLDEDQTSEALTDEFLEEAIAAFISEPVNGEADRAGRKNNADKQAGGTDQERSKDSREARSEQFQKRAMKAWKNGDVEQARNLLEKSLDQNPRNRDAWRSLSKLHQQEGDIEAAMQTYRDWQEALPNDALPHYLLADSYERLGMDAEALAALEQFNQMSGGKLSTYPMIANMYKRLDMRAQEGAMLQDWAAAAPNSADAHQALADYYRKMGNDYAALDAYEQVLSLEPGRDKTYVDYARMLQRVGRNDEAQLQLETAVDISPDSLLLRRALADAYRSDKDFDSALDMYMSIIELEPGSTAARYAERRMNQIYKQQARQQNKQ